MILVNVMNNDAIVPQDKFGEYLKIIIKHDGVSEESQAYVDANRNDAKFMECVAGFAAVAADLGDALETIRLDAPDERFFEHLDDFVERKLGADYKKE